MRFIEHYPDGQDLSTEVDGRTVPLPALVEDDDGIRLLLLADDGQSRVRVSAHIWSQAHAAGAAALVIPDLRCWMLAETFMDGRSEHPASASYRAPDSWSGPEDDVPSYRQMIEWTREVEQPSPREDVVEREEVADSRFVHLHTHSEYSPLDGLSMMSEMVAEVVRHGQGALAVTDHGMCAGHPALQKAADEAGIKPIFGIEANFTDDRLLRGNPEIKEGPGSSRYVLNDYYHLVLWAMDDIGLRNLWAMSTEANRTGFYGRPRMDWEVLETHAEGVLCGTGCLRGPVSRALLDEDEVRARAILARLMDIFPGRLYVEIHTNQLPETIALNRMLVDLADEYDLPMIASVDSHYPRPQDAEAHRVWIASQTRKDLTDDADLFAGSQEYHLMGEAEVRQALAYLDPQVVEKAVENTGLLADRCTARVTGKDEHPIYSKVGADGDLSAEARIRRDIERLVDLCLSNWEAKVVGKPTSEEVYVQRFEREMGLLIEKEFCGYFNMVADYCAAAKDGRVMQAYDGTSDPIIVGPGRGSGGGSLVAYLADITELDPVDADLLFERFLTEGRVGLPDFDVDFPESKRDALMAYLAQKYGEDHILRVGTHVRLQNKGVVRDMGRVLKSTIAIHYPDLEAVSKIIDAAEADKAGLGMSWEDLWEQSGEELAPYRAKYPLLFQHADSLVGRLKSYGKHPAGVIIATDEPLTDRLPMRSADGQMVAEFGLESLEELGFVKFDLLTLRTLDTIQETVDQIRQDLGVEIDVYSWREEYEDPQVWEEISDGHTLGIFQIETRAGTRLTKRFEPGSLSELADVITLVRPGPVRSGLTEIYFQRRAGLEPVTFPDPRLETVLAKTYGTMLYQEDIMAVTMALAGYDSNEADAVRKILGKKQVEKVAEAGHKFVAAAIERGMAREDAEHLWEQMAEFAKYCVSGDTRVHLAASGKHSGGTITAKELYRRINAPLLPPTRGRVAKGQEYTGPCVVCGATSSPVWTRGACRSCYVWRQKFQDVRRGLYGLTVEADGRVRPARILMVHKHEPAQTWTITLADGKHVTATGNHRHLTPEGLRRVDELAVGDALVVDGGYEVHRYTDGEQRTTVGERLLAGAINGAFGEDNHGYVDGGFASLMAWTAQAPDHCQECGHDGSVHRLERAHLDGDHANNDWSNLAMLCVSCHKKHDYVHNGRRRRWGKGHITQAVPIVSIEPRAVEPVYSVVMDDPHIWIANGIATANSFNRAHAYGYAVLGYWTAWLKFHYPAQYLNSLMTTVDKGRIPEFVNEARRMGYEVLPPDINLSGEGFSAHGVEIRYGLDKVKGVGAAAVKAITQGQPYTSVADYLERKGSAANSGVTKLLAAVGAFDSLEPNRKALEARLAFEETDAKRCVFKDETALGPGGLPCTFDWANEKDPPLVARGRGKDKEWVPKPPPKRCTTACRNFTPATFDPSDLVPYTDAEIRDKEMDLLGIHLSSTPFDTIPAQILDEECFTHQEVEAGPEGEYVVAAIVSRVKPHTTRTGKPMAFLSVYARTGDMDVTVFSTEWERFQPVLRPGLLCFAYIRKNDRGVNLLDLQPID